MELAEALKTRGRLQEAQTVFNQAKQVAKTVRLDDLVRGAEAEFSQPVGDTAAAQLLAQAARGGANESNASGRKGSSRAAEGEKAVGDEALDQTASKR